MQGAQISQVQASEPLSSKVFISIALLQAFVLTFLYQSFEHQFWPGTSINWLSFGVTLFLAFPSLFLLLADKDDVKSILKYLLPFSLLISLLAAFVSDQSHSYRSVDASLAIFTFTMLVACFKVSIYSKAMTEHLKVDYSTLYILSWRHAVIFAEVVLFVSVFFAILHLGASLFNILGITVFSEYLDKPYVFVPLISLSSAFAIRVFKRILKVTDGLITIIRTLIKFLLIVLLVISLGFLFTLPFTGVAKIWDENLGSFLILWLMLLTLMFFNSVYQGTDLPYTKWAHRLAIAGILALPIYSVISAYGIFARIDQYGFTPDRLWALSLWLFLSSFAFAYGFAILRLRDNWLRWQSNINVALGLAVLAYVLLVNSPLLNFKAISAASQIARYEAGELTLKELDINFFFRELGRPGEEAMIDLQSRLGSQDEETVALIQSKLDWLAQRNKAETAEEAQFKDTLVFFPDRDSFPQDLIEFAVDPDDNNIASNSLLLKVNIDGEGDDEFVLIQQQFGFGAYAHNRAFIIVRNEEGRWQKRFAKLKLPQNTDLMFQLEKSGIELVDPKYKELKVGEVSVSFN